MSCSEAATSKPFSPLLSKDRCVSNTSISDGLSRARQEPKDTSACLQEGSFPFRCSLPGCDPLSRETGSGLPRQRGHAAVLHGSLRGSGWALESPQQGPVSLCRISEQTDSARPTSTFSSSTQTRAQGGQCPPPGKQQPFGARDFCLGRPGKAGAASGREPGALAAKSAPQPLGMVKQVPPCSHQPGAATPPALRVSMPVSRDVLDPTTLMTLGLKALPELLSF